jgi:hypothetical protein
MGNIEAYPDGWLLAEPMTINDTQEVTLADDDPSSPACTGPLEPCWSYPFNVSIGGDPNGPLFPIHASILVWWSDANSTFNVRILDADGNAVPKTLDSATETMNGWGARITHVGSYTLRVEAEKATRERFGVRAYFFFGGTDILTADEAS